MLTAKGAHERLLNKFGKGGSRYPYRHADGDQRDWILRTSHWSACSMPTRALYAQDYRARERTFSLITQGWSAAPDGDSTPDAP